MRIGPPAVGSHDCLGIGEQALGAILVAVAGEVKEGVTVGEHSPQRALLAGGAPAGLVHVQALAGAHALSQILIRVFERPRGALQDRLDRAGAQARAEELFAELHDIAARYAVAHRQRRHGRFKARAEGAVCDLGGQLSPRLLAAAGTAHARATVLDHLC